ncbi:hypothetical protein CEP53_006272, partial [Fusarium sp. AF-6]
LLCQVMRDLEDLLDLKKFLDQVIPDRKILSDKNNLIHLDRVLHELKELLDRDKLLDRGKLLDLDLRLDRDKLHALKERLDQVLHDLKELLNREKPLNEDKLLWGRVLHNLKKLLHLNKLLSLNSIRERNPLQGLVAMFEHQRETMGDPDKKWQWHAPELLGFFESSLPKVLEKWPVWLFVDALDECGKENAIYLIKSFQALIKNLPPTTFQFKICFSCRHYPILQLDYGSSICMEHENMRDIVTFVHTQLSTSQTGSAFTIANTITHRASGVFLWARLVVERVLTLELGGEGLKNMEAEIQRIPPDLDALYDELIRSMEKRATSRRLMEWICFSAKPLSIDQLRWTMVVDPDCPHKSLQQCQQSAEYTQDNKTMERRVKTLSCGLAEIVQSEKTVQFIHQSVKDFFLEKGLLILANSNGNLVSRDLTVGLAHYNLSRTCIHYLAMEEFARFSRYGLTQLLSVILQKAGQPAVDIDCRDNYGWTSLSWAALGGHEATVKLLLNTGKVDINARDEKFGRTPLWWAAEEGHKAVVTLLLNTDNVDVNARDTDGRTLLWRAGEKGDRTIAKLLLDSGKADSNARDKEFGWTLLSWAAKRGDVAVVELLVGYDDVDVDVRDNLRHRTPLSWAAQGGHKAVVKLLLDTGKVDVNARDREFGRTPLSLAAQKGHKDIVKLLLDTGNVDVNSIYANSTHFLLELLQNADDNTYDGVCPTLRFTYKPGNPRIDCNEVGFTAENVEAICAISQSTKSRKTGHGEFIGEKGIGFKSAFKVADVVWISSNDFTFKFDKSKSLGMVTPIWADFPGPTRPEYTPMYLQLSEDYDQEAQVEELLTFDMNQLMFLRRIEEISVQLKPGSVYAFLPIRNVLKVHGPANFDPKALTRDQLISHATFLYQASWRPPKTADIWFSTVQDDRCLGRKLYIPGYVEKNSTAARIFAYLQKQLSVMHGDYLDAFPSDPDWLTWLVDNVGLSMVPRLVTPPLDPEPQPTKTLEESVNEDEHTMMDDEIDQTSAQSQQC